MRLQSKLKPQPAVQPSPSPVLSASQRADVMRDYGLDDVGVDVASWDDGLELEGAGGSSAGAGKKARNGDKKKKGLGAVVMDDV